MSVVDKMLIKGIRSFSPENTNVITFYRPLTLIVGPNGAGKTTVIECLKHACTGEMPPNSRSGHTFIHDPKVAGETETKGQIKLRFKTGAGKDVVCIRSFQLSQKGSKMEFKAIESVLQTINPQTGEKLCLSYRCADMDREVPTLMGVSKAILENVIFVHQDDANWPLAEGAVLKKKFDDIFSATKYTKALEVIKKLHKDQAQEIKMYKLKLENLHTLKDAAHKLRDSIEQDQQKASQLRSHISDLEMKIKNSEKSKLSIESAVEQLTSLQSQIGIKDAKREMLLKLKSKQYLGLEEEIEDTDEELTNWQSQFHTKIGEMTVEISQLERGLNDSESTIQFLVQSFINDCQVQGKLKAEVEMHLQQKQDRDRLIEALFAKHHLGAIGDLPLSDELSIELLERAAFRLDELSKDHEQRKEANQQDVALLWGAVEKATERFSQAEGKVKAKLEQKNAKKEELQKLENLIKTHSFSTSTSDVKRLDENERSSKEEVDKCSSAILKGDFDSKISTARRNLSSLEEKLKVLQREKDNLASESSDRIYLRNRREQLINKESHLTQILEENKVTLTKVLKGRIPTAEELKDKVYAAISSSKESVSKLNGKLLEAGKETVRVSSVLEESKINLAKYQREKEVKRKTLISRLNSILHLPVEADAFPEQLRTVRSVKDQKKQNHDIADGMKRMFDPFEKRARSHHACPCCERPFTPQEEDDFVRKQRTKNSTTGARLLDLKREKDDAENQFQSLEKLRAVYDDYQKLVNDLIPAAEKTVVELTNEQERVAIPYDDLLGLLAQANSEFELVDNLRETADLADRLYHEIVQLKKQVHEEEIKLDTRSQTHRTLEHVNNDLTRAGEQRDSAMKLLDQLREEQSLAKDEFAKWNLKYHDAREKKLKGIHIVETLNKLKSDRAKLEEQLADIAMDIEMLEDSLGPLSSQKDSSIKEHDALRKRVEAEEAENSGEIRKFKEEVRHIRAISSQIAAFVTSGKETKFKEVSDRLSSFKAQQEKEESHKAEIAQALKSRKDAKTEQNSLMRNIDDNLKYRMTIKEIEELDKEIRDLEQQMIAFGESEILQADLQKIIRHIQDISSQQNRSQGTVAVYQNNVARNKADLKQAQYKDIDNRYCGMLIQLKTTEMANKDLDKYYGALDKALMRFHSMKMEEINKIIKELWQQTYRGQDIDYIEIRSDAEGAGTRSYSYRVIMRSGDAEMEMRGRCSAGQKVLASLVIRLALAETFCLNCGILALDEPTTNLDGPNAESLASALGRIMEERRSQENFQLIVITHDERFAHLIGQREHAERYYRISKDDNQHSIIEAQEIFD